MHTLADIGWAVLWAVTLWTSFNTLFAFANFIQDRRTMTSKELNIMVNHRRLSAILWAILIVFLWN